MSVIEDITYCDLLGTGYSEKTIDCINFLDKIFAGFIYYMNKSSKFYIIDYEKNILTCCTTIFLNSIWQGFNKDEICMVIAWYMKKYHNAYFEYIDTSFII